MGRATLIFSLVLAAGASGCRGTTVASQNLDAVLSSSDNFRYRGATTNRWKDLMEAGLNSLRSVVSASNRPKEVSSIPNPTENLVELASSTQGSPAWRHNEQVRTLTRYAAFAPSQLCREYALDQLSSHALRLGVSGPFTPTAAPASPAELIETVDSLTDALRGAARRSVDATARADFAAALALAEDLEVDIQGGARLLRALGPFLGGRLLPSDLRERLGALSLGVQGRMVAEALWRGARDPSTWVRAAAMRVGLEVHGESYRVEALLAFAPTEAVPKWVAEEYRAFDLPRESYDGVPVFKVVAAAYTLEGFPFAARRETRRGLELRRTLVVGLLQIAVSDTLYPRKTCQFAMGALSALSDGEVNSLRREAWQAWWQQVDPVLLDQIEAATDE